MGLLPPVSRPRRTPALIVRLGPRAVASRLVGEAARQGPDEVSEEQR